MSAPACRAFEERLVARLDLESGRPFPVDPHAADCSACTALLEEILSQSALFGTVRPPQAPRLMERLKRPPEDFAARREAAPVLDLLTPGALLTPEPSKELLGRLIFLPTRAKSAAARPAPEAKGVLGLLRRFFSDWRLTVVGAYAMTLLLFTLLRVDPLLLARDAASDLTYAGERAVAEAKTEAVKRFGDTALARAADPLRNRFQYRVYRTVTAARARATAYSTLVFEKVFGGTQEASDRTSKSRRIDEREPRDPALRS